MTAEVLAKHGHELLKAILNIASAIFGLLGTWLMARRYAQQFLREVAFALFSPLLFLIGRGNRARAFVKATASSNLDLPDSVTDMALGLILLFWAFFLQLGTSLLDLWG